MRLFNRTRRQRHTATDAQLLLAWQKGDKNALAELIARLGDELHLYLLKQLTRYQGVGSETKRQLACDIGQKSWLKIIEYPRCIQVTEESKVKVWLFKVARNALLDEYKQQNRLSALYDEEHISMNDVTTNTESSASDTLADAMATLPFLQRDALSLQLAGFSVAEIADITHSEKETVKTRLRYAKTKLAEQLTTEETPYANAG